MVAGTYQDTLTGSNVDLGPVKSGYDDITEENAVWDDGYPLTPDLFMGGADAGYPEGTLKQLAMDGRKGSQYATDPSDLRIPFHGITYVELADGMDWDGVDFGTSDGVLIVHNSSGTAQITNLNTGTFRGLIIADELVHIHCRVIGAVVALSPNPVTGNCIGNGTGDVLYSTKALKLANKLGTGTRGDNVAVVSWYE